MNCSIACAVAFLVCALVCIQVPGHLQQIKFVNTTVPQATFWQSFAEHCFDPSYHIRICVYPHEEPVYKSILCTAYCRNVKAIGHCQQQSTDLLLSFATGRTVEKATKMQRKVHKAWPAQYENVLQKSAASSLLRQQVWPLLAGCLAYSRQVYHSPVAPTRGDTLFGEKSLLLAEAASTVRCAERTNSSRSW